MFKTLAFLFIHKPTFQQHIDALLSSQKNEKQEKNKVYKTNARIYK